MLQTNKLYNISFPDSISAQDALSFIRWNGPVVATKDKLFLPKGTSITTDTYHNFFAIKKLRQYTVYKDFNFVIKGSGKCFVELIGIGKTDFYSFEHVISIKEFSGSFSGTIEYTNELDKGYDVLYLRIIAYKDVIINDIEIFAVNQKQQNQVSLAYCICSYNRENYISSFVKNIATYFLENKDISFYIAINGEPYSIAFPENFEVLNNRNLGGAGGFTKAMVAALENKNHTHIILGDDDISIDKNSINKTLAILKGIKPEYSDYFISGAMLSADENWLQYERNASLSKTGFIHHGAYEDTRSWDVAYYSAIVPAHPGIAGWWYCCIPIKVINEYNLPIPVFVRGDDVEYSIRCSKNILSFNGICVWHEPFFKKYNEVMEDYYLVRNLAIISLIYNQEFSKIRHFYIFKKFFRNIFIFDYVGAKLNIKAIKDILDKQYLLDAEVLHKKITQYRNDCIDYKAYTGGDFIPPGKKHIRKGKYSFKGILQYFFNIKKGNISSLGGYDRDPRTFLGKKRAYIYMGNNSYRLYRFKFKKSWGLIFSFVKCYYKMYKLNNKLQKELIAFRDNSAKPDAWKNIFDNK